jgi:hypothetical protein
MKASAGWITERDLHHLKETQRVRNVFVHSAGGSTGSARPMVEGALAVSRRLRLAPGQARSRDHYLYEVGVIIRRRRAEAAPARYASLLVREPGDGPELRSGRTGTR